MFEQQLHHVFGIDGVVAADRLMKSGTATGRSLSHEARMVLQQFTQGLDVPRPRRRGRTPQRAERAAGRLLL